MKISLKEKKFIAITGMIVALIIEVAVTALLINKLFDPPKWFFIWILCTGGVLLACGALIEWVQDEDSTFCDFVGDCRGFDENQKY